MFNLVQIFLRLGGLFVFLFLEIICFTLVVRYNQTQQDIYTNSVNRASGFFHKTASNISNFFSLDDENYRISRENTFLLERLLNAGIDTTGVLDTTYAEVDQPKFTFVNAKVIKNSIRERHNYLVLDVGRNEGVAPHTGVIAANGVVGIVRKVSNHYAVAMSVLHSQTRISAKIKSKDYFGSLVWNDPQEKKLFDLNDIPKHADLEVGDTVETSGYSAIFPEGIMLGLIEEMEVEPGNYFYNIKVRSTLDMANIQHVYVVKNLLKKEQEELEQAVLSEDE